MHQPSGQKHHNENKHSNKTNIYSTQQRKVASVTGLSSHIIQKLVEHETFSDFVVFHNIRLFWW